ncbi:MAG: hypothetical protein ACN4GM_05245 [Gammaproteobacteria bacterium]
MKQQPPRPGVSRPDRISTTGLERLEKQLAAGIKISRPVLAQWIKRYGEPARDMIKKYDQYSAELDLI